MNATRFEASGVSFMPVVRRLILRAVVVVAVMGVESSYAQLICPEPAGQNYCLDLLDTDCAVGDPADFCLPRVVQFDPAVGIVPVECACFADGPDCGPIAIDLDVNGVRCPGDCIAPDAPPCQVWTDDGTGPEATGLDAALVTSFPAGTLFFCDCAPSEACCLFDGRCIEVPPEMCCDYGGIPQGPGTDCDTVECPTGPPIWTGMNIDIHQDNPDIVANDFHMEGIIESEQVPILIQHIDDLFTGFVHSIYQGDPWCPAGSIFWCFEANWDGAQYPFCQVLHLGLLFEVVCHNVMIDLVGWWTIDGVPVGGSPLTTAQATAQAGYWPIVGFDVEDNIRVDPPTTPPDPRGQTIRLKNGGHPNDGGQIQIEIISMDLVSIGSSGIDGLLGPDPLGELRLGGLQERLPWVPVVDEFGELVSPTNPTVLQPGDEIMVLLRPAPGLSRGVPADGEHSAAQPVVIEPGGYLIARGEMRFQGNGGPANVAGGDTGEEIHWFWELHGAHQLPEPEACCFDDGTCANVLPSECVCNDGTPFGAGTWCTGTIEACCDPITGICTDEDPVCCAEHGGIPQGPTTDCGNTTCQQDPTCDLPTEFPWCDDLQTQDCVPDGTTSDVCLPRQIAFDAAGQPVIELCDCFSTDPGCGPVDLQPDPLVPGTFTVSCPGPCPPNENCWIHIDDDPTDSVPPTPFGPGPMSSTAIPAGFFVTCDCAKKEVAVCDLPPAPAPPICKQLQDQQCVDDDPNKVCEPLLVFVNSNGDPVAEECRCVIPDGTCGPVNIFAAPVPPGGWTLSCEASCPNVDDDCEAILDGTIETGLSSINSFAAVGHLVSCECITHGPPVCPLPSNTDVVPICATVQDTACIADDPTNKECLPRFVALTATGLFPEACECFDLDDICGPVTVTVDPDSPGDHLLTCEGGCASALDNCWIHVNNGSRPTSQISTSQLVTGDIVHCDCVTKPTDCAPNAAGDACVGACPNAGEVCVPKYVQCTQGSPPVCTIIECGCPPDETDCHVELPQAGEVGPQCTGGCPPASGLHVIRKCIRRFVDSDMDGTKDAWDCRCVGIHAQPGPNPSGVQANRYLTIDMGGGGPASVAGAPPLLQAMRVTMDVLHDVQPPNDPCCPAPVFDSFEGEYLWVGPVLEYNFVENPPTTFRGATLQCEPYWFDFASETEYSIYAAEILPNSWYSIQIVDQECEESLEDEECYSAAAVEGTGRFADVATEFQDIIEVRTQPNVLDIAEIVDHLKGVDGAIGKTRATLEPNDPNPENNVTVLDVANAVDGVKGAAYPFSGPCICPSAVVCEQVDACSSNGDCSPGRCIGGFCTETDACGRCTAP